MQKDIKFGMNIESIVIGPSGVFVRGAATIQQDFIGAPEFATWTHLGLNTEAVDNGLYRNAAPSGYGSYELIGFSLESGGDGASVSYEVTEANLPGGDFMIAFSDSAIDPAGSYFIPDQVNAVYSVQFFRGELRFFKDAAQVATGPSYVAGDVVKIEANLTGIDVLVNDVPVHSFSGGPDKVSVRVCASSQNVALPNIRIAGMA